MYQKIKKQLYKFSKVRSWLILNSKEWLWSWLLADCWELLPVGHDFIAPHPRSYCVDFLCVVLGLHPVTCSCSTLYVYMYIFMYIYIHIYICILMRCSPRTAQRSMGWLLFVGSLKIYVSNAKEPYNGDCILQKWHIFLRSLLIIASP